MQMHLDTAAIAVTVSGNINGASKWDCTLWFRADPIGSSPQGLVNGVAAAMPAALNAFGAAWKPFNDDLTQITDFTVRYYAAGASGASVIAQGNLGDFIDGNGPAGAAASQAVVTTLLTGLATRSGRGRLYWPATAALVGTTHGFDPNQCQALATATITLYGTIMNTAPQGGVDIIAGVRSIKLQTITELTAVRVDTRPDRQEHRETKLGFTSHTATFPQ